MGGGWKHAVSAKRRFHEVVAFTVVIYMPDATPVLITKYFLNVCHRLKFRAVRT